MEEKLKEAEATCDTELEEHSLQLDARATTPGNGFLSDCPTSDELLEEASKTYKGFII